MKDMSDIRKLMRSRSAVKSSCLRHRCVSAKTRESGYEDTHFVPLDEAIHTPAPLQHD
jgi:hypothetical protein